MNKTEKMPLKTVRYCFLTHLLKYAINVLQEIPTDRSPQAVPKNSLKSFYNERYPKYLKNSGMRVDCGGTPMEISKYIIQSLKLKK